MSSFRLKILTEYTRLSAPRSSRHHGSLDKQVRLKHPLSLHSCLFPSIAVDAGKPVLVAYSHDWVADAWESSERLIGSVNRNLGFGRTHGPPSSSLHDTDKTMVSSVDLSEHWARPETDLNVSSVMVY